MEFCIYDVESPLQNRCDISNVLANRTITNIQPWQKKIEIVKFDWAKIKTLVTLLKPLQIITTVFSGENTHQYRW